MILRTLSLTTEGAMRKTLLITILAALCAGQGCTTIYDDPNEIHSFKVSFSQGKTPQVGSEDERLTYVSGHDCTGTADCMAGQECVGYCTDSLTQCTNDEQCGMDEACAQLCATPVYIDIEALGRDGKSYLPQQEEMWVNISVHPGFVPPSYGQAMLIDGKAQMVKTYISRAVGESQIWVEDMGITPKGELYGQCNDNKDNDGDGWIDMADPGCMNADDDSELNASYATGLSPSFFYDNPTIFDLQNTTKVASSPLKGEAIHVNSGRMVVTNTSSSGFFVTDVTPPDDGSPIGHFRSVFMYTFSKPVGVDYGDTMCSLTGGVVEYMGNTQIKFPSFEVLDEDMLALDKNGKTYGRCTDRYIAPDYVKVDVPEPVDVTELLVEETPGGASFRDQIMSNSQALEPYESGLIKINNLAMASRFLACDKDENGNIDTGDEDLCRDECQNDPLCTQLESYFKYRQVTVFAAAGKKFYLSLDMLKKILPLEISYIGQPDQSKRCLPYIDETGETIENPHQLMIGETRFTEYNCPPMILDSVSGSYRQIYLCKSYPGKDENCSLQMAMLVPRFDDDVTLAEEEN
jgi:hypothetical protein